MFAIGKAALPPPIQGAFDESTSANAGTGSCRVFKIGFKKNEKKTWQPPRLSREGLEKADFPQRGTPLISGLLCAFRAPRPKPRPTSGSI
jgi:hypothetical protein